ncbi:type II secretion system protein [Rubrivivax sp. A210]|uniref:type IV pilus modification PilV family protein n=1 Tax=Rubrivivax sp. A210 TaxID=2772301 RepID=UPI0019188FB5|nr:type II secretion system protein [Rubrivivax sp. A210]
MRARLHGLSLVELLIFIVVVSAALAGVLQVFVQATATSADPLLRRQALAIAESLLEEVQLMPFTWCDGDDANVETATSAAACAGTPEATGPEAGENRYAVPQFDHANDYHGYATSGIVDINQAAVPGLSAYSASVSVASAALNTLTAGSGDALRITVTVSGPGATQVTLEGYRSRHAPNASL